MARGSFDYGHLSDADLITRYNQSFSKDSPSPKQPVITRYNQSFSKDSPSPKQPVASSAIATGVEVGYDFLSLNPRRTDKEQRLYLFGRYEYYDSMYKTAKAVTHYEEYGRQRLAVYEEYGRQRLAVGVNYYPLKEVVLKGEYSIGLLKSKFNNSASSKASSTTSLPCR